MSKYFDGYASFDWNKMSNQKLVSELKEKCIYIGNLKQQHKEEVGAIQSAKDRKISDLEAKLAESEKKAYSRGHSQRDIANEIKLNALREDVANKEKRIVELKQQLAITEKALELACREITGSCEYCSYKTRIECPVEADCLDEKINYFKTKAKEIINGYKQDD